jgi:hypothetical protein
MSVTKGFYERKTMTMRVIASSDENTIALPERLITALHLNNGDTVEAIAGENTLHLARVEVEQMQDSPTNKNGTSTISSLLDRFDNEEWPTMEEIVAWIKATPNPQNIHPGEKVKDLAYIDELLANPPTDTITAEEWAEFWPQFEQELKEFEQASDIVEGRL